MTSPASAKKSIGPRELTVMMASLMALNALAIDAMLPAFPAMAQGLKVSDPNQIQYIISVFLAGTGIGALIYGPLSDRYGRKPILLIAIIGAAVFSLACSITPALAMLRAFRAWLLMAAMGVLVISLSGTSSKATQWRGGCRLYSLALIGDHRANHREMVLLAGDIRPDGVRPVAAPSGYICACLKLAPENVGPEPHALAKAWKAVVLRGRDI
jgi:hypothetical protein